MPPPTSAGGSGATLRDGAQQRLVELRIDSTAMIEAFGWGALAGSSLLVGGALALRVPISELVLGLVMAFGCGALISAVAYELVREAFETSAGSGGVGAGLAVGSLTFFAGQWLIARRGGGARRPSGAGPADSAAMALILGIALDGIPESLVIGLSLLAGGGLSVAMLVAVVLSNVPEAMAATTGLRASGWRPLRIMGLWAGATALSGVSALAGHAFLGDASPRTVAFVLSFAGGAIITMIADTMMPEAHARGGRAVGLVTTLGFGLAFAVSALE